MADSGWLRAGLLAGAGVTAGYLLAKVSSNDHPTAAGNRNQELYRSNSDSKSRVLSIQSSVVYGYVGNKASVFPLQLMGLEVDPVHSCQFSNHTGYPKFTGSRATGEDLDRLVDGMQANGMLGKYTDLLTGYMASASFLKSSAKLVQQLLQANPSLFFLCDPVMGDDGKMYTPTEFVDIYREELVPYARFVTPNQTEAELLTGITIKDINDVKRVCQWFHEQGIRTVVITSCYLDRSVEINQTVLGPPPVNPYPTDENSFIDIVISSVDGASGLPQRYHLCLPKAPKYLSGTGDLSAALMLAWMHRLEGGSLNTPHSSSSNSSSRDNTFKGYSAESVKIAVENT